MTETDKIRQAAVECAILFAIRKGWEGRNSDGFEPLAGHIERAMRKLLEPVNPYEHACCNHVDRRNPDHVHTHACVEGTRTPKLQPTYFVQHPDNSYSVADPQPILAQPAPIAGEEETSEGNQLLF